MFFWETPNHEGRASCAWHDSACRSGRADRARCCALRPDHLFRAQRIVFGVLSDRPGQPHEKEETG